MGTVGRACCRPGDVRRRRRGAAGAGSGAARGVGGEAVRTPAQSLGAAGTAERSGASPPGPGRTGRNGGGVTREGRRRHRSRAPDRGGHTVRTAADSPGPHVRSAGGAREWGHGGPAASRAGRFTWTAHGSPSRYGGRRGGAPPPGGDRHAPLRCAAVGLGALPPDGGSQWRRTRPGWHRNPSTSHPGRGPSALLVPGSVGTARHPPPAGHPLPQGVRSGRHHGGRRGSGSASARRARWRGGAAGHRSAPRLRRLKALRRLASRMRWSSRSRWSPRSGGGGSLRTGPSWPDGGPARRENRRTAELPAGGDMVRPFSMLPGGSAERAGRGRPRSGTPYGSAPTRSDATHSGSRPGRRQHFAHPLFESTRPERPPLSPFPLHEVNAAGTGARRGHRAGRSSLRLPKAGGPRRARHRGGPEPGAGVRREFRSAARTGPRGSSQPMAGNRRRARADARPTLSSIRPTPGRCRGGDRPPESGPHRSRNTPCSSAGAAAGSLPTSGGRGRSRHRRGRPAAFRHSPGRPAARCTGAMPVTRQIPAGEGTQPAGVLRTAPERPVPVIRARPTHHKIFTS